MAKADDAMTPPPRPLSGFRLVPAYLDPSAQKALLAELSAVFAAAPLYTPRMPKSGKALSVRMTNCGPLGWVTDEAGYRYQPLHPQTGKPWPAMPDILVDAWKALARYPHLPESCLVNYYDPAAKMGLHQDRGERDFEAPVVSLSLGDTCVFRIGGTTRKDPTRTLHLASGDAIVLGGEARVGVSRHDLVFSGGPTPFGVGGRGQFTPRRGG